MYVNLVAPIQWGTYQGFWELRNPQGQPFGPRFWVGIRVPNPNPPTPAPPPTPSTGISFTVDRTQIKAGECVTFRWDVEGVKEVYFYAEGESWEDHGVTGHESRQ
ncbi:MAG: hypothetical protein HGA98_01575, partial [Deltaproteobacteria bacterium]|nr:hypothetical protein [Deltaproteobacteria bacterium]